MVCKTPIAQTRCGLADAQTAFQIRDRRSLGRFLGLDDGDNMPDETMIARSREALARADAIPARFARFDAHPKGPGYPAVGGQILDASIMAAPRQRITDEERASVKQGGIPEGWRARPARLAQKDRDARRTLRRGRRRKRPDGKLIAEIATPIFGRKSHIGIERAKTKIGRADIAFNVKRCLHRERRASVT